MNNITGDNENINQISFNILKSNIYNYRRKFDESFNDRK
jgi:hypothetical protein